MRFVLEALRSRREKRLENEANEWIRRTRTESTERLFAQKVDVLKIAFGPTPDPSIEAQRPDRLDALYLGSIGLDASVQAYAADMDALPDFMGLLRTGRSEAAPGHLIDQHGDNSRLHTYFAIEPWFGGKRVHVLSNDNDLFARLTDAHVRPPPPWVALPDFQPPSVLLQGDQQFWFENVWDPYFQPLTREERAAYLATHDAPAEWVEDLSDRAMRPTNDPEPD
jgi:hypothetical protein